MGVLPGLRTLGIAADEERRHSETLEIGHVEPAAPRPGRERVVGLGSPGSRLRPAAPGWLPLHATSMAWASPIRGPSSLAVNDASTVAGWGKAMATADVWPGRALGRSYTWSHGR